VTEHVCTYPLLIGTTWRCTCKAHWMQPTTPAWPLTQRKTS
jgi:hypothetical protein